LGTEIRNGIIIVKIVREHIGIEPTARSSVRGIGKSVETNGAVWVIRRWIISGVSGSCWVTGVREGPDSVECGSVLVPRWIDSMDAEVLLSSFLILGLHGDDASDQSHQYQKALK
jgi:hypothetical protein